MKANTDNDYVDLMILIDVHGLPSELAIAGFERFEITQRQAKIYLYYNRDAYSNLIKDCITNHPFYIDIIVGADFIVVSFWIPGHRVENFPSRHATNTP